MKKNDLSANKELVQRIYDDVWNQANPAAASQIFASPGGVEKFVREFLEAIPDLQHTVDDLIAEDDRVVAVFRSTGTHTGDWRQVPAKGNQISYSGVTVVRIADGKIIEHHTWWDQLSVYEQMQADAKY